MECQVTWILQVIQKLMNTADVQAVSVSESVVQKYNDKLQQRLQKLALGGGQVENCNAWFVDPESGKNLASLSSTLTTYWRKTRRVNWDYLELS